MDAQNEIQQCVNHSEIEWRRGGEIYIPVEATRRREGWLLKDYFWRIPNSIKHHEMKEATTIFELALWKAKIDQGEDDVFRTACRIEVPGPVKDCILQYLNL